MGPGPGMPVFDALIIYGAVAVIAAVAGLTTSLVNRRWWLALPLGFLVGVVVAVASSMIFSHRAVATELAWHPILICVGGTVVGAAMRRIFIHPAVKTG
jgi:hypothetical protein